MALLMALGIVAATFGCSAERRSPQEETAVTFSTEYQTVLLSNGQVFIGKLEGLETRYPVITDVYSILTVPDPADPENKTTNVLMKRGQEWHGPDRTILNASNIVLIEPVTEGSKVAQLIEEDKNK